MDFSISRLNLGKSTIVIMTVALSCPYLQVVLPIFRYSVLLSQAYTAVLQWGEHGGWNVDVVALQVKKC